MVLGLVDIDARHRIAETHRSDVEPELPSDMPKSVVDAQQPEQGAEVIRLIEAAMQSSSEGRTVRLV